MIEEEEKKLFREFVGDVEPINQSGQRLKIPVDSVEVSKVENKI